MVNKRAAAAVNIYQQLPALSNTAAFVSIYFPYRHGIRPIDKVEGAVGLEEDLSRLFRIALGGMVAGEQYQLAQSSKAYRVESTSNQVQASKPSAIYSNPSCEPRQGLTS
jgi:hypothetical protein